MAKQRGKASMAPSVVAQMKAAQNKPAGKTQSAVLKDGVAENKARVDKEMQQKPQQRVAEPVQRQTQQPAQQQTVQQTQQPAANQSQQQDPKDNANETPNNEANQSAQTEENAGNETLNVASETQQQGKRDRELSVDSAERILQIEGILNTESLTPEEQSRLNEELSNLKKEAQMETKTNVDDSEEKEGDKFEEGDIIKYLYGEFLKFVSERWDRMDHFLKGAAIAGGEALGKATGNIVGSVKASIRNIMAGKRELDNNVKEQELGGDYRNAARALEAMRKEEVNFYQERRDFAIDKLQDAAALGGILAKGMSLESIEAQYAQLSGKSNLSKEEKKALDFLKKLVPEKEDKTGIRYSKEQREINLRANIDKLREEYKPKKLVDLAMPRKGETQEAFTQRFNKENLETINSSISNCVQLCNMQESAAYTAKLQALAECAGELKPGMTTDEKTEVISGTYLRNMAEIDKQIRDNFGDPVKDGMSEDDLKRYGEFLTQRNQASTQISQANMRHIDQHHNMDDRQQALQDELGKMHAIGIPKEPEGAARTGQKREGIDSFADEFNKPSPTGQLFNTVSEKLRIIEQRRQENAARKAYVSGKTENTGKAPATAGKNISMPLKNNGRE